MISYKILVAFLAFFLASAEPHQGIFKSGKPRVPTLTSHDLNVAVKVAEEIISKWHRLEINLVESGIEVLENTPSHGQLIESYPSAESLNFGKPALVANRASLYLVHRHCQQNKIFLSDCLKAISQRSLSETPLGEKCYAQFGTVNCTKSALYRTYDGSCNNIGNPTWGKALTPYKRVLPALYANGIDEPRRSVSRRPLPSPRVISNMLIHDLDKSENTTLAFVQWTQFISNDLSHTPVSKMIHMRSPIECCNRNGQNLSPRYLHPICLPINIPVEDPDYSPQRTVCMNYVRSVTSLRNECNFGPADQMNQATHFLDASMIYGSSATKSASLRYMKNGRLTTSKNKDDELLPMSETPEDHCQTDGEEYCFKSGDSRVNLHPHHTTLYTIWVREHNRIAKVLSELNPHWDDETIFEEARRIVIAEIQHITYKYWVPHVLGSENMKKSDLDIKTRGFSQTYLENIDPAISNSFSTAGLRFMNSMFQGQLRLYDEKGLQNGSLLLKDHFNKPTIFQEPKIFQQLLRGLSLEASQKMDASFVKDMTSFLFRGSSPLGQDVASLDIQRGRDHGLQGYNAYRKYCGLPSSGDFESFSDTIPPSSLNKLKMIYNHPDDVDLIVGAILETSNEGSLLGPVFQCIIKEQMIRTRKGDRFFYDIGGKPHSFKEGQINEIKKVTLSRILCDNDKNIHMIQPDLFNVPSPKNPMFKEFCRSKKEYVSVQVLNTSKYCEILFIRGKTQQHCRRLKCEDFCAVIFGTIARVIPFLTRKKQTSNSSQFLLGISLREHDYKDAMEATIKKIFALSQ